MSSPALASVESLGYPLAGRAFASDLSARDCTDGQVCLRWGHDHLSLLPVTSLPGLRVRIHRVVALGSELGPLRRALVRAPTVVFAQYDSSLSALGSSGSARPNVGLPFSISRQGCTFLSGPRGQERV